MKTHKTGTGYVIVWFILFLLAILTMFFQNNEIKELQLKRVGLRQYISNTQGGRTDTADYAEQMFIKK